MPREGMRGGEDFIIGRFHNLAQEYRIQDRVTINPE